MAILPNLDIPPVVNFGLLDSFNKTGLDLEDIKYRYSVPPSNDVSTNYPSLTTGTPTLFSNPASALPYQHKYKPLYTYLSRYPILTSNSYFTEDLGEGRTRFDVTNFDLEGNNSYGFFRLDESTAYPPNVTGTPIIGSNPGPPTRFFQTYIPSNPYISSYPMNGLISRFTENLGRGRTTFDLTNFDLENSNPSGFFSSDTSTAYGVYSTGTPTTLANPSNPKRFSQLFFPTRQYLDKYSIAGNSRFTEDLGNGLNTLNISNFDVEQTTSIIQDTTTNYPPLTSGTPTLRANPGPAKQFVQTWVPTKTYLDSYPIKGESRFTKDAGSGRNTFDMTDLDTSAPGVNGGIPYNQQKDPKIYPLTTNGSTPVRGYFATACRPVSKFKQVYSEKNTYSNFINAYI